MLLIGRYRMLHQSGSEVNAQSTDAVDFARRNTRVKAAKAVRKLSPWESLAEQSQALKRLLFGFLPVNLVCFASRNAVSIPGVLVVR